jgi:hypothetical protein
MTKKQVMRLLLEYEIRSSRWAWLCFLPWLQKKAANYYIAKVRNKLRSYYSKSSREVLTKAVYRLTKS